MAKFFVFILIYIDFLVKYFLECYNHQYYMRNIRIAGLFLSLVLIGIFTNDTHAQESAGIKLVPATIEPKQAINPGDVFTEIFKVTNESNQEKEYYIYKKDIIGVETGGVPIFSDESIEKTGFEISEWIEIPTEPIKVPAFGTIDLPITIRVPESATPGSHFGGIFISVEAPKLREIGAGVGYEVASIVTIRISGDIIDTARVRSFSTDKLLYSTKNVQFTAKIENQGNILIRPRGPVEIRSMFNSKPEVIIANDKQDGVFPGTMRDIEFEWNSDGLGFGRYEAILALVYDGADGQKTIDASLVFWVFPIKIMLGIIGALIAVIVIGYALTKYYINQAIIRASGGRRITSQRYRKQVGVSRFTFVSATIMLVLVAFLLIVMIFFA